MTNKRDGILVYAVLLVAAFSFRGTVARLLANDSPDDGKVYSQIARNLLEQHVYSHETEAPYRPSLIRLPGYPIFIAGVYSVFGHGDDTGVRIVQALLDTATCALIALITFLWEPEKKFKRRSSIAALVLAALCPFTTIYVATILTETPTMFLAVAMSLTATLALNETRNGKVLLLWVATGLLCGLAVLFRPDSGLFALAIGSTLVVTVLSRSSDVTLNKKRDEVLYRFSKASYLGAVFSLAFCLVLVPWTVRNFRVFHIFQPLAPAHAVMPGEFVPRGYFAWVRTWLDDGRYVGPVLWTLDASPIKIGDIPERAFDSAEEKQRVAALLDRYNHPPQELDPFVPELQPGEEATPSDDQLNQNPGDSSKPEARTSPNSQADKGDDADEGDEGDASDETDSANEAPGQTVEMTPEIDAGFAQLAKERIARHPIPYYFLLPARRAASLWLDTHSQYYPFEGELLPFSNLDNQQQFWLPVFSVLMLVYTLLGIAGGWFLWQRREFESRKWVLLAGLIIFLRIGFFGTVENPEPRYVVEVFPFLAILGGIALTRLLDQIRGRHKTIH
jgi:hypothetical protein